MISVQPVQPVLEPPQKATVQPAPPAASPGDAALGHGGRSDAAPPSSAAVPPALPGALRATDGNEVTPMPDAVREAVVRVITLRPSHLVITNELVSAIGERITSDPATALATQATHSRDSVLGLLRPPG